MTQSELFDFLKENLELTYGRALRDYGCDSGYYTVISLNLRNPDTDEVVELGSVDVMEAE